MKTVAVTRRAPPSSPLLKPVLERYDNKITEYAARDDLKQLLRQGRPKLFLQSMSFHGEPIELAKKLPIHDLKEEWRLAQQQTIEKLLSPNTTADTMILNEPNLIKSAFKYQEGVNYIKSPQSTYKTRSLKAFLDNKG